MRLSSNKMKASLIIPTYNGAERIIPLINALEAQSHPKFEILIVVDGSTDSTLEILRNYQHNLQDLRIICQENRGRSGARNTGISNSTGEVLILLDDDMHPVETFVERHLQFHENHPGAFLVGGCLHGDNSDALIDRYRRHIEQKWMDQKALAERGKVIPIGINNYIFTTQNLSMPTSIIKKYQVFDESLSDSEDFDLFMRMYQLEVPIFFDNNVLAYHEDYKTLQEYIERQKEYFLARKLLGEQKPEYIQRNPKAFERVTQPISKPKLFFSRLFEFGPLWKAILDGKMLRKMVPEKFLFRLLDIIIFSSSTCYLKRNSDSNI